MRCRRRSAGFSGEVEVGLVAWEDEGLLFFSEADNGGAVVDQVGLQCMEGCVDLAFAPSMRMISGRGLFSL